MSSRSSETSVKAMPVVDANGSTSDSPSPGSLSAVKNGKSAAEILFAVQSARYVIQDFRPLSQSIDWELGQFYWRERGGQAFISDAVPFVINNDSTLSANSAELFFTNLEESDRKGSLGAKIFALEIGVGIGLFARYFLDAFRDICLSQGKDYYERFCYVAADHSERMLGDIARNGVLDNHASHYELRLADALSPEINLRTEISSGPSLQFRAVFLNYVLDTLPATVLKVEEDVVSELWIRTCMARNVSLNDYTPLTIGEIARLASSPNPSEKRELIELYPLFALEYDYQPIDPGSLPYGEFAVQFGRTRSPYVLHNYGALQCVDHLLDLLEGDGFILINDYPHRQPDDSETDPTATFQHQRFAGSTAIGLNLSLLQLYFEQSGRCSWWAPSAENGHICARLLTKSAVAETSAQFCVRFDKAAFDKRNDPVEAARTLSAQGQHEAAIASYAQALAQQQNNWSLMSEIANLLTYTLCEYASAVEMIRVAIDLNPLSVDLWNTLGDCLFYLDRKDEAHDAFLKALELNPDDVRARYNLVYTYAGRNDFASALKMIAEGLAYDKTCDYSQRFLNKQTELLNRLAQRQQEQTSMLANRFSRRPASDSES